MQKRIILETQRLSLRELEVNDFDFILRLVNTPGWLEYIGDRGIKTKKDAIHYLENGPIKSYRENGYGLWLVQLKEPQIPIGMCGLLNREELSDIDIGFALLPDYEKLGYGYEIASATLNYARYDLKLDKIIAITDPRNSASIKLLNKIGLHFEKTISLSDNSRVLVFSPASNRAS